MNFNPWSNAGYGMGGLRQTAGDASGAPQNETLPPRERRIVSQAHGAAWTVPEQGRQTSGQAVNPLANALTDEECAASFVTFHADHGAEYPDAATMLSAFSALSPHCARWVAAQLAAIRSANSALEGRTPLEVDIATDAECLDVWNTYAATVPGFETMNPSDQGAAVERFRSLNPGCSGWLDRQLTERRAPTPSGGGSTLMMLAAAAAVALLASGKKL